MIGRKRSTRGRRRYDDGERKYPPTTQHRISLDEAVELTQRYRKAAPASEHGGLFDARQVRDLLSQEDCVGFRYYHGLESDGTYHIVLVGVNSKNEDIVPEQRPKRGKKRGRQARSAKKQTKQVALTAMAATSGGGGIILQNHLLCPPVCSTGSPLN